MKLASSLPSYAGFLLGCTAFLSGPVGPVAPPLATEPLLARGDARPVDHVLLIAVDGVRARDVFEGADASRSTRVASAREVAPNLTALAERGFALGRPGAGRPMQASGPNFISLPGYTEMLTGRAAPCQENGCEVRPEATLVDAFYDAGVASRQIGVITSWSNIQHIAASRDGRAFTTSGRAHRDGCDGLEHHLLGALDKAADAEPYPGGGDYRPDERTVEVALEYARAESPRFLFVSLGDTDEYAHADDYDRYLDALGRADAFVGELATIAEQWRARGETAAILVTTDHGRADNFRDHGAAHPESAAVWLVAGGNGVEHAESADDGSIDRLADIAPTIRELAGLQEPWETRLSSL